MNGFPNNPKSIISHKKVAIWLGILVFMRTQPCYLWRCEEFLRPICAILILLICIKNISHAKWTIWILLSIVCAYIWATIFVDHSGIITTMNFLAFAFIPTLKQEIVYETYKVFRKLFVFFLGLSIINYFLVLIGIDFGGIVIEPLNKLKQYKYVMYPFLVTPYVGEFSRFHSVFDEPGVVGTISGLILIAEQMNLQKKSNYIILIGGLLSLSFYFYVAMIFGFILFSKKLQNKWLYISFLLCFIVISYNNDFLYNTLWHRFEYDANAGKFAGDNRNSTIVENAYESIVGTPLFFTGLGSAATTDYSGSASLQLIILKHGFIFVALNLLGYLLLSIRQIENKKDLVLFFVFFILTLYQRPGFYNTSSIFLYVMVINMFGRTKEVSKPLMEHK